MPPKTGQEQYAQFVELADSMKKVFDAQDRYDARIDDKSYAHLVEARKAAKEHMDNYILAITGSTT